jgi:ubiquinone/menaquinone biosynthesis C-methylase UbiE
VLYDGKHLPFKDDSSDAVVSLDTIEHLPKDQRWGFCKEMLRVARRVMILCAPFGTPEHIEYEKRMLVGNGLSAENFRLLTEHVEHGLPTPAEVAELASKFSGRVYYQGTFLEVNNTGSRFLHLWLFLQVVMNVMGDLFWKVSKQLKGECYFYTNRFFLVVPKEKRLGG